MRIVVDLQAVQVANNYTLALTKAMLRYCGSHEIILVLNGLLPDFIEFIRAEFLGLISPANIRVWHAAGPVSYLDVNNRWRRKSAERIREAFLASLKPDIVYIPGFFKGLADDGVTSIGEFCNLPTVVHLDDLISFTHQQSSAAHDAQTKAWYLRKLGDFRRANLVLAISVSPHQEGLELLDFPEESVINIATVTDNDLLQSSFYDWNETAKRILNAFVAFHQQYTVKAVNNAPRVPRPKLAYVSPQLPVEGGIADYNSELLPELSLYYDIELIATENEVENAPIAGDWPVRSVQWFLEHAEHYERVVYHFRNTASHSYLFDLLEKIRGTVVLHDFYLSDVLASIEQHAEKLGAWSQALYHSHGYRRVFERISSINLADVVDKYPANLPVLQNASGIIVHSQLLKNLINDWYVGGEELPLAVIPQPKKSVKIASKINKKEDLGYNENDILVCSFDPMNSAEHRHRIFAAWEKSTLSADPRCHLIFVGDNPEDKSNGDFVKKIRASKYAQRIKITEGLSDSLLMTRYLAVADVSVQLSVSSSAEPLSMVLACLNYGVATITNINDGMLDDEAIWRLHDGFSDAELVDALETLCLDDALRLKFSFAAKDLIERVYSPKLCAKSYWHALESFYNDAPSLYHGLIESLARLDQCENQIDVLKVAQAISQSFVVQPRKKKIFVDISELVGRDSKSGVQRVVRSILKEWLLNTDSSYQVEPVYAKINSNGYKYARQFAAQFIDISDFGLGDEPIEYACGDLFIVLDLQHHVVSAQKNYYQQLRNMGVIVKFVVYDLLPILLPDYFIPVVPEMHHEWLKVVAENHGALCISQAVAHELSEYLAQYGEKYKNLEINYFHLGADIENSIPSLGVPNDASPTLGVLEADITFLAIGTIEPRKGYQQLISAFDLLWQKGFTGNLAIVGRQGWHVDEVVSNMINHPLYGKKLFWFNGVSDEYLSMIIKCSNCLVAASLGEGFGLPLIEAAQNLLPIIARDIPVFKEVAADHAFYFSGTQPEDLSQAINSWLKLYHQEKHPLSINMPHLTWQQSAAQLLSILLPAEEVSRC